MCFLQDCKKCNFEVLKNQIATYVLMCKVNIISRDEQGHTNFFWLFDVKKRVEVSFTSPEVFVA